MNRSRAWLALAFGIFFAPMLANADLRFADIGDPRWLDGAGLANTLDGPPQAAILLASNEGRAKDASSGKRGKDGSKDKRGGKRDSGDKHGKKGKGDKHGKKDRKDRDHASNGRSDRDRPDPNGRNGNQDGPNQPGASPPGTDQPGASPPGSDQPSGPTAQTAAAGGPGELGSDSDGRTDLRISPLPTVTLGELLSSWFTGEEPTSVAGPAGPSPTPGAEPAGPTTLAAEADPSAAPGPTAGPTTVAAEADPSATPGPTAGPTTVAAAADPSATPGLTPGPTPRAPGTGPLLADPGGLGPTSPDRRGLSPAELAARSAPSSLALGPPTADPTADPAAGPSGQTFADLSARDSAQREAVLGGLMENPSTVGRGVGVSEALAGLAGFAVETPFDQTAELAGNVLDSALADPDPRVRQRAAAAIGRVNMAVAQAIPVLFSALCSRDVRVQKRAAIILAGIDDYAANVVPALSERIARDDDPAVTRASVQALGNLGVYAVGGLPTLVSVLEHDDLGVRYHAGDSIGSVDDQMTAASSAVRSIGLRCGDTAHVAVLELTGRLQPDRTAFRDQATRSLAGIAPAARTEVVALNAQLEQGSPEDRQRVVQGLSDAARFSSAAVASLVRDGSAPGDGWEVAVGARPLTVALRDTQGDVRQTATAGIREASKEVTIASIALQDAPRYDPAVRRAANRGLASVDEYASVTVPGLLDALKDEDVEVRRAAAQAIGELGPHAGMTAPALVDAVKSEPAEVGAEAALALGRIHGEPTTTVPTLSEALDHPEPAVRYQAARALGLLGGDASPAAAKLQAALEQPDPAMRYQAARALTAIDPAAVNGHIDGIGGASEQEIAHLLEALRSQDPVVRRQAGQMLGNLGPAAVATLPYMAAELAGAPPATRQELAWTMQDITSSALADVPALIEEMRAGGPGADRAARILGELGAHARLAKQDLIEALDDPDPGVRLTVAELLGDISDYTAQVIGALMVQALEQDEQALAALERHAAGG